MFDRWLSPIAIEDAPVSPAGAELGRVRGVLDLSELSSLSSGPSAAVSVRAVVDSRLRNGAAKAVAVAVFVELEPTASKATDATATTLPGGRRVLTTVVATGASATMSDSFTTP